MEDRSAEMTEQTSTDFERLLGQALTPVDPPASLSQRLEATLTTLTEMAAEELESWELSAMRDPRNWVRPVVAAAVGTAAGAGLFVLRARAQQKRRKAQGRSAGQLAERAVRDAIDQVRRVAKRH
jgi:23S rRNA A2030 N6-methylase RlmJ